MAVQVPILVANVAAQLSLGYTKIEVWVSSDSGGNYTEATAATSQAASLTSNVAQNTFNMGGKQLRFKFDGGTERTVTFGTVLTQWTPTQVVAQINAVLASAAAVVGSTVVLTSPTLGRVGSVEITYSDSPDLGFSAGQLVYGRDARLTLNGSILSYTYIDISGTTSFRYKWRLSANGSNPISGYSAPVYGAVLSASGVPLSVAFANFISLDGKPMKARLIVVTEQNPLPVAGFYVTYQQPILVDSDEAGFLQMTLVQGTTVRVAIEGTAFIREFLVPNTASFDILQAMSTATDPFTVVVPPPFLVRRII